MRKLLLFILFFPSVVCAQSWSGIINPTRAENWTRAGVGVSGGIPSAAWTQCGSTIAAYNGSPTTINNALAACGTNQYVKLGAGTFNLTAGITINKSNVVLRGSGPNSTFLTFTNGTACYSTSNICMVSNPPPVYILAGTNNPYIPPCTGASTNCADWTGGFAQNATSITVANVGSAGIHNGDQIVLDQQQDTVDNGGYFICFNFPSCNNESAASSTGRFIGGNWYLQEQYVTVQGGCNTVCSGAGPFTITISPGLYENNWNHGGNPVGIFFTFPVTHMGIEDLNMTAVSNVDAIRYDIGIYNCVQCWVKDIVSSKTPRGHILNTQSPRTEIRDSYFYGTQNASNQSYGIETGEPAGSDILIENNIFQQIASPIVGGGGQVGTVVGYNFAVNDVFSPPSFLQGPYITHDAQNSFQLWEGNVFPDIINDSIHGTAGGIDTFFRNHLNGYDWNSCNTSGNCGDAHIVAQHPSGFQTFPVDIDSFGRGFNIIGNVLGMPGFHNQYENFTGNTVVNCRTSIYVLGWSNGGVNCTQAGTTPNDTLVRSTMMRWGNYDVVNAAVRWDSTESSPGAVLYIGAQSTPASHTLPASFYQPSKPSFFGSIPWPPIGPDVVSGNLGIFTSGTYALGTCPVGLVKGGATCQAAYTGLANVIPAMDCYYNKMGGSPDGVGPILPFDGTCYSGAGSTCPSVTFNPLSGFFTNSVSVQLADSCTTIIYTTDGTTPTETACSPTNGTVYTVPIVRTATTTIHAIACQTSFTTSADANQLYNITQGLATPTFVMNGAIRINGSFSIK